MKNTVFSLDYLHGSIAAVNAAGMRGKDTKDSVKIFEKGLEIEREKREKREERERRGERGETGEGCNS